MGALGEPEGDEKGCWMSFEDLGFGELKANSHNHVACKFIALAAQLCKVSLLFPNHHGESSDSLSCCTNSLTHI